MRGDLLLPAPVTTSRVSGTSWCTTWTGVLTPAMAKFDRNAGCRATSARWARRNAVSSHGIRSR
ncbi:hypothetical protein ACFQV2_17895 [Actinokineospora soli]|uniref:Uncharacterized protein n=1 Tax=Actinokineospora soli TaxID=1048753 RepID=A0ABW2TQQ2_9PSEU